MFFTRSVARMVPTCVGVLMLATGGFASYFPGHVDCPKGAVYLATANDLRGACGVAFAGETLLVATPEAILPALGGTSDRASQVARIDWAPVRSLRGRAPGPEGALDPDAEESPVLVVRAAQTSAGCAVDVAVDRDGSPVVVDLSGCVWWGDRCVGQGVLEAPVAVTIVGDAIAVSDVRLRAVVVFDRAGRETARLGTDHLVEPAGLAVDTAGSLLVADRLGHCLWRFRASATGFESLPERIGARGSGPGQFSAPRDVAVLSNGPGAGCILVADELNHRIQVLDPEGRAQGFFGMHALVPRQGDGRIHYPRSIAVAPDGSTIAVAEAFEDRVQFLRLKPDADIVDPTTGSIEYISSHFGSESAAGADLLVVVDVETQSIAFLDARSTPPLHISIAGGSGALPGRFGEISALSIDAADGRIYVADRVRDRIDVLAADWQKEGPQKLDLFIPRLVRSIDLARIGDAARLRGRTPDIRDMLVGEPAGGAGRMLLLDRANLSVIETDTRCSAASATALPMEARMPEEFARRADGTLFVADPVAGAVFERAPDAARDATGWIVRRALGGLELVRPSGVACAEGLLVVVDAARDACVVWDGAAARVVGERGGLDEQFFDPASIAETARGFIVIDRGNHRFQRFAAKGDDPFAWNMTGGLGRYFDRKRRGSPGFAPPAPAQPTPAVPPPPSRTSPPSPGAGADASTPPASSQTRGESLRKSEPAPGVAANGATR